MPGELLISRSGDEIELRVGNQTLRMGQSEAENLALKLMLLVFEAAETELLDPTLSPSFVARDPIAAWGAVEGGHLSLMLFPGKMRPISFVFTNDDQLRDLLRGLDQSLRIPKSTRLAPPTEH